MSITLPEPEPEPEDREKIVLMEYLPKPSTQRKAEEVLKGHTSQLEPYWMDSILAYLKDGMLLAGKMEARKVLCQTTNYALVDGILYK